MAFLEKKEEKTDRQREREREREKEEKRSTKERGRKTWIGSVIGISNSERLKYLKEIITRDEQSGQETWKFLADYSPAKNPNKSVSRLFSSFFVVGILDSKLLKYPTGEGWGKGVET